MKLEGPLIVTGASGILVQLVLRELLEVHKVPASKIIAVTRSVEKLNDFKQLGVEVCFGDFNDANSLRAAFKGGHRALIVPTLELDKTSQQLDTAIKEASHAGVKHIVLAGVVSQPHHLEPFLPELLKAEELLAKTPGITHTVLGYNIWMESQLEWLRGDIEAGTLYTTSAAGKAAFISRDDYAKACAAALVSDSPKNVKYELTGPEAIDRVHLAALLTESFAMPKPLKVVQVSEAELLQHILEYRVPEQFARFRVAVDRAIKDGNFVTVGKGFEQLTGKHPQTFAAVIERNKEALAPRVE